MPPKGGVGYIYNMVIKESKIPIAAIGGSRVSLRCMTIGEGVPRTLLLSGIHGNEKTGQLVISELLRSIPSFSGTLTILPIANPAGFEQGIRVEPLSNLDLNRQFFDSVDDAPALEIIKTLISLARRHDYVIDLHNFTTAGLVQVVSNHIGNSDYIATLFRPDVVRCAPKEQGLKKKGTLAKYLKGAGIPYILLELPVHHNVLLDQLDRVIAGLCEHLKKCTEHTASNPGSFRQIPRVSIKLLKAERLGVFMKKAQLALGSAVAAGEIMGELETDLEAKSQIYSPYAGIVCEMDNDEKRIVSAGETLVGIGEYSEYP